MASRASAEEIAVPNSALAQADVIPDGRLASNADPAVLDLETPLEVPEELEDLREMGQQVGDLLSEIDPEVIQQVMRPLGRQALRIFLESAPGLSQKAIELGEQGLEALEKRAAEGLEQAQENFELND